MLLIAGLGNPGRRYGGHRHNIGFMAADEIHRRHRLSPWRARFEGETSEGTVDGEKVLLLKPATYMNESGRSIGQAMRFYKLSPKDVVAIYDELDLPPGKLRMKAGGSTAGHKGLKSIEAHIGKDFRRMRIGIGHPGAKELVNGYVLHDFAQSDREWIGPLLAAIADNVGLLAAGNDANFMNRIHLATAAEEERSDPERRPDGAEFRKGERNQISESRIGGAFAGLKKLFSRGD
jgi:PTH1 family peptidyl-tRNA hydrolase